MPILSAPSRIDARQALVRLHVPFALPVLPDERDHGVVHERAAGRAHQVLFFGKGHSRVSLTFGFPGWERDYPSARSRGNPRRRTPLVWACRQRERKRPCARYYSFQLSRSSSASRRPSRRRGALTMQDVNAAEFKTAGKATQAVNIKAQVLLDRAGFSPGAIDGRASDNFENALRAFQKRNALRRDRQARQGDVGEARAERRARADRIHDHRGGRERPVRRRNPGQVRGQGEAEAPRLHQRRRDAGGALPHGRGVAGGAQSRQGSRQGRHGDCRRERQREAGRAAETGWVEGRQDRSSTRATTSCACWRKTAR